MPIKKRMSKARPWTITPEVLATFKRAEFLQPIRDACDREAGTCQSEKLGTHCASCNEYLDCHRQLDRLLSLPPWAASPLDEDLEGPPQYGGETLSRNQTRAAVLEIRNEILKALKRGPAKA